MPENINIQLNISESEQMSSHQNASLHGGPNNTAISIDTEVKWPVSVQTEEDVNNLSLKEDACKKAFYFKENSQEENLD